MGETQPIYDLLTIKNVLNFGGPDEKILTGRIRAPGHSLPMPGFKASG